MKALLSTERVKQEYVSQLERESPRAAVLSCSRVLRWGNYYARPDVMECCYALLHLVSLFPPPSHHLHPSEQIFAGLFNLVVFIFLLSHYSHLLSS